MNAMTENLVTCAEPRECAQPGTVDVKMGSVVLEFCEKHARGRVLHEPVEG
jgi:hypothetical protein